MAQGRVRSARSPSPLQLFPLGRRHCIHSVLADPLSRSIEWDMRYKEPSGLDMNDLAVAATQPSVPIVHLYFPSLPTDMQFAMVKPYGKAAWWDSERILEYVTLGDVFMAILDHLRVPLTEGTLTRMGAKNVQVTATCGARCANPQYDAARRPRHPRRVDCLGTNYVFSRIVPTEGEIAQRVSRSVNAPVLTVEVRKGR